MKLDKKTSINLSAEHLEGIKANVKPLQTKADFIRLAIEEKIQRDSNTSKRA